MRLECDGNLCAIEPKAQNLARLVSTQPHFDQRIFSRENCDLIDFPPAHRIALVAVPFIKLGASLFLEPPRSKARAYLVLAYIDVQGETEARTVPDFISDRTIARALKRIYQAIPAESIPLTLQRIQTFVAAHPQKEKIAPFLHDCGIATDGKPIPIPTLLQQLQALFKKTPPQCDRAFQTALPENQIVR